jgi:pimeloyl-ACP methyl ester carboxylesterase
VSDAPALETLDIPGEAPPLVLLHEGLGSVSLWRDFPEALAAATGRRTVAYSRRGYGRSPPIDRPRSTDYMHREALDVLPAFLKAHGLTKPILVGHSDGASIALIHAGAGHVLTGLVAMAPHVFVEDFAITSIAAAREAWATTDLKERLQRHHDDVEGAFLGWNDIWLDPAFRAWNIERYLEGVACPLLLIQGKDDEYGTMAQLDAVEAQVRGPVERVELEECRHSPHRDQRERTLDAIAAFVERLLRGGEFTNQRFCSVAASEGSARSALA